RRRPAPRAPLSPYTTLFRSRLSRTTSLIPRAGLLGSGTFNLGSSDDYRVPDRGFHRSRPGTVFVATAPVVVEIRSPDDETFEKLDRKSTRLNSSDSQSSYAA